MNGYCFLVLISTFSLFAVEPTLTVNIPMRDGTKLPADLYFPPNQQEQLPCILVRSPAGRQAEPAKQYIPFASKGYLVVIQETRSSLDSEGKTLPYISDGWGEQQDGYDTVEWLAHVPYTNGRVGTLGPSALGMAQMMLAPTAPPSLKCQYICNAAPSLYHYAIFAGGQLLQHQVEGWLSLYARDPLVLNTIANQPYYNDFWQQFNTLAQANKVSTPAVHEGGWYDMFVQGTIDGFCAWQHEGGEGARKQQKLIIGPWSHFWPYHRKIGDYPVPHNGEKPPIPLSMESWLAHHLKGEPLDLDTIPPITYYVMGPFDGSPSGGNIWRHADNWPLPCRETPLYLCRDRSLNFLSAPNKNLSICYLHDPNNPVPTHGGRNLFIESGPLDQRIIEERDDVIVFTSPPLEEEIEITGRIFAKIYASCDQPHTDLAVRLTDVYPDGKSLLIADGLTHLYNPNGRHEPQEVEVDLWSTSTVITKGHRIRLSITNSNSPRYRVDTRSRLGKHTLHFGPSYPSRLLLPVVRTGNNWFTS